MTKVLTKAAKKSATEVGPHVPVVLSTMANSCMLMLKNKKVGSKDNLDLCGRAMVGSIVIFDNIDQVGPFSKKNSIDIKQCVSVLKRDFTDDTSLINALRYSTRTFRDAPAKTKALFE